LNAPARAAPPPRAARDRALLDAAGRQRRGARAAGVALLLACGAPYANALTVTTQDCREGAEFIFNAARSRDNGVGAERFLSRLDDDLMAIRAFPKAVRWFARDDEDETLLRRASQQVFERPEEPIAHRLRFLSECLSVATDR
jgi:hypothetical protein